MVMMTRRNEQVNALVNAQVNAYTVSGVSPVTRAKLTWPRTRDPLKYRLELSKKFAERLKATKNARVKEPTENACVKDDPEDAWVKDDPENEDVFQRMLNSLADTSASVLLYKLPYEPSNWMDDVLADVGEL